ncbi:MAG TPA: M56 family metallopeptidase [Candidatus Acidoferrum sp.]|nr:M56 family metallopeptidase [Candidatus Acidoferrum sp.]
MTLPYFIRLIGLCGASFFLVHAVLGIALRLAANSILRFANTMKPRDAARFLMLLRFLPFVGTTVVVLGICLPSYLWLEPGASEENVGAAFIAFAVCGASILLNSLLRSARALAASRKFGIWCRETRIKSELSATNLPVDILDSEAPVIFLAGVFRPRLALSTGVLRTLSPEQRKSVFRHEEAHRASRDNFKRLLLLLTPEILPFSRSFRLMDEAWAQFSEWAADDDATGNDPGHSLSLAESLVRVARMSAGPRPLPLFTSFIPPDHDLSVRVNRLLGPRSFESKSWRRVRAILGAAACALIALITVLLVQPSALQSVHELLEHLTH